jgi:hypothetical protein
MPSPTSLLGPLFHCRMMIIYRLFLLAVLALGAAAKNSKSHAHAKENSSRKLRASSLAESWSFSGGFPSWFSISPSASGQGAATATVDQGLAGSSTASQTTSPEFYLDCICLTPNADTTAEVLSEAFASGVTSAESRAASKAVALAGDKCCSALGRALAKAASFAESQGQGNAFVTAASRSQAEAKNLCGREAIANAISGSRAVNANGEATASASATGAQAETQTESTVGQGFSRSSSTSWASSGKKKRAA